MTNKVTMSAQTVDVLRSFEGINRSIMFRRGQFLNTSILGQNIIAEYECEEEFPQTFAIYELGQFLKGLSLFEKPSLQFDNNEYVTIRSEQGRRSAKYFFSDPSMVEEASPDRKLQFPEEDVVVDFRLTEEDLRGLWRAAGVYELNDVSIEASEDTQQATITVWDVENETNNTVSIVVNANVSTDYKAHLKVDAIQTIMQGNYDVSITDGYITRWKNNSIDLVYYISTEDE
jgi:hypothetical protein